MTTLPPYNEGTACVKCGFKGAKTLWQPAEEYYKSTRVVQYLEYIERRCTRCGYTWGEQPMDGEKKGD